MTRPRTLALALALGLAACSDPAPAPAPAPASAPASSPTGPAYATTTPAPATSSAAPAPAGVDGEGLCSFLEQEIPALQQAGSAEAARSRFTGDVGLWTVGGPGRQLTDATVLDALATRDCPEVRTRVLTVLEAESLNAALG